MEREKFSVLISVYKREKPEYFDAALESIYKQTLQPDEVVICTDGELTPQLNAIIDKYNNLYPSITNIVRFKRNRGLGPVLHDGLLRCRNNIVFRMDSDDISVKDRFEKQLDVMKKTGADVVGSSIIEYDEGMNTATGKREVPEYDAEIKQYAKRRNPINHMSVCYRKNRVVNAGNYLAMDGFEDYYLWARMIKDGAVFYNIQSPLVSVRGGDSMIKRRGGHSYVKRIRTFEKKLKKIGFISTAQYYSNILPRVTIAVIPSFLRQIVYNKALRGANNG